jgi:REP element-mobilizing transposase RayT
MGSPENQEPPLPVGRVPPRGADHGRSANAGSGDPAYKSGPEESPPRRLRRLHCVWPDRDGNLSYLLTVCIEGRVRVLDNQDTFQRLSAFLLDSPTRYHWFARRFVVMPDHLHLIAHQGHEAVRLGQWMKALKAVVGGLERRDSRAAKSTGAPGGGTRPAIVGRVPSPGGLPPPGAFLPRAATHQFTRLKRAWRWQEGFHDHKFRTPESEQRKWEYVCLNPVRYGLVEHPEQWPFGGEIFYEETDGPRLVRGTPPLLETGLLIEGRQPPAEGSRPTT